MKYHLNFLLFCIISVCSSVELTAQENKIIPVSPEAAALAKMVNYPVNLNTGIPDISIPFYDIKAGNLTLPVKFIYHGGGFKINEHATPEGLGWSLSTNLQITRSINGLDDFAPFDGYIANSLMKSYDPSSSANYLYPLWNSSVWPYKNAFDIAAGQKDGQPDKFNYSLLGKAGSFYFMKNTLGTGYNIVPVPYDNLKITYNNGQFIIVDTDGTTYYFGEQGSGDTQAILAKGKELTGNKVTGWKCIRIESYISSNTIYFSYQPQSTANYKFYNDFIEFYDNEDPCNIGVDGPYCHSNESPLNGFTAYETILQNIPFYRISSPKYMVHYANKGAVFHVPSFDAQRHITDKTYAVLGGDMGNEMQIASLALSQIEFRGGKVKFSGTDKLTAIEVFDDHGAIVTSASLYQSYTNAVYANEAKSFNGINFQGTPYLDSIHIRNGGTTFERYAFLYNDKFCYGNHLKGHDAWGYPNASTMEIAYLDDMFIDTLYIPRKTMMQGRYYFDVAGGCGNFIEDLPVTLGGDSFAEAPNEPWMKKGTLKRIVYPTGGFVDFDWEGNKYLEHFDNGLAPQDLPLLGGGLRIRSISYFSGGKLLPETQEYYRYGDLEDGTGVLINSPRQGLGQGTYYYDAADYSQQVGSKHPYLP